MSGERRSSSVVSPSPPRAAHAPPSPAAGLNTEPGSQDDGWETPPPVTLGDGTRIYLYKDGEGLKAALDAIRKARVRICAGDSRP